MCDEKRKKETKIKKTTGTLYKLSQRSERGRLPLKQGVLDLFIVGDIDSVYIEGTFNVLILYRREKREGDGFSDVGMRKTAIKLAIAKT